MSLGVRDRFRFRMTLDRSARPLFLRNQMDGIAAIDMFVVVTAAFRLLYVSVILGHARRKILHLNVTQHPTASWLSSQITEPFRGTLRHATCCETATRRTGDAFRSGLGL